LGNKRHGGSNQQKENMITQSRAVEFSLITNRLFYNSFDKLRTDTGEWLLLPPDPIDNELHLLILIHQLWSRAI
jgi:hypothetical protein